MKQAEHDEMVRGYKGEEKIIEDDLKEMDQFS